MAQQKPHDVNEPSRRRLLKGSARLAARWPSPRLPGGACGKSRKFPRDAHTRRPSGKQPFYGPHQAGILTPQQASMMLVAFDVLASDVLTSSVCFGC